MENNWEDFDDKSIQIIKELTKDSEDFSKLIKKLNSAKENLIKEPFASVEVQEIKK